MNMMRLLASILLTQLMPCVSCSGIDDHLLTPSKILAESRLKIALRLTNGPDIYPAVAHLFDDEGTVDLKLPGVTSEDVNLAWKSNPEADQLIFSLNLVEGTAIIDVLGEIAKRRLEYLTVSDNHVTIMPKIGIPVRKAFQKKSVGNSVDLDTMVRAVIPTSVMMREPDGDTLEKFLNVKLQTSWHLFHEKSDSPFRVKINPDAKAKVNTLNIIGNWTYQELFESVGLISGLQWQIDGKTVVFGNAEL